ncbi:MAG: phage holin family protein [Bryobacterales bacterium]|nr:phage holin family protein [Bryobacterales bacterium]
MTSLLIQWLITAVALIVAAYILPGMRIKNFGIALVAAAVLGVVNALIRPVVAFFSFPITFVTLGLFALVINGLMLMLVSKLVPDFEVDGCLTSILGAILISIVSALIMWAIPY